MVEISNLVTPSPEWWDVAIKGMRNPFKSRDKSDSGICLDSEEKEICYEDCQYVDHWEDEAPYSRPVCGYYNDQPVFVLGREDKKLLLNLCKSGTSHRKVLRQLPVIMDIKAPLYWWKQMDQFKLGTCTNSESTMHTLIKKEFELDDFSITPYEYTFVDGDTLGVIEEYSDSYEIESYIDHLNYLREIFLENPNGKKEVWNHINELLPQSYLQTRTWSANYEVLVNIIEQRRGHKLKEWNTFIEYLLKNIPYLNEIMEAIDG